METSQYPRLAAQSALDSKIVRLSLKEPFTWSSGYKAPVYVDNRLSLHHIGDRNFIAKCFREVIKDLIREEGHQFDAVVGVAKAGIAWAVLVSNEFGFRFAYASGEAKDHGLKKQIECIGDSGLAGARTLVIEDLISTGGSSAKIVQAVRDAGGQCDHIVSIFNYGFKEAAEKFGQMEPPCQVRSIFSYDDLLEIVRERKYFDQEEFKALREWRDDPFGWGEKRGFPRVIEEKV